jgi:hypothetical protein
MWFAERGYVTRQGAWKGTVAVKSVHLPRATMV